MAIRRDGAFLGTVRRGLRPLPFDRQPAPGPVFGPLRGAVPPPLTGRVGVVATGGSGALASLVGVAKALQDSGTEVSVYSVCSGSALFGFPLGAGMPPDEVAELTASMRPGDYIDVGWREIAALIPTLAWTLLVEPVPYQKVAGTGFYEQFLDTREWPQFMRAGREAMLASLRRHAPGQPPSAPWSSRCCRVILAAGVHRRGATAPGRRSGVRIPGHRMIGGPGGVQPCLHALHLPDELTFQFL